MNTLNQLAHNPAVILGAYFVFNAVVSGMPAPDDKSGAGYKWLYGTLHLLSANFDKLAAMKKGAV